MDERAMAVVRQMMARAEEQARAAEARGDAPYGAVLVDPFGNFVQAASNTSKSSLDITAHAEMNLVREASAALRRRTFEGFVAVVTGAPCAMCTSALVIAEIRTIFYGAPDQRDRDPDITVEEVAGRCRDGLYIEGGVRADM